jgi:hypothetical protein
VRCLAPFVVLCLLLAGASTRCAERDVDRPTTEIVPVGALAKVVVRRHDIARGVAKLELDPFTLTAIDDDAPSPRSVAVAHAAPLEFVFEVPRTCNARGPPVG